MDPIGGATQGMGAEKAHPAMAKGRAAAQACGEFVMELRRDPSCDQDEIDVAAKELRKAIMDTLACLKQRR